MDTLFRLPAVPAKRKKRTLSQLQLLDLVALHEGSPLAGPLRRWGFTRQLLRRVISMKLVECISIGPGHYKLTPLGRAVRSYSTRKHPGGEDESGRTSAAAE
jgi:hypothetical protein